MGMARIFADMLLDMNTLDFNQLKVNATSAPQFLDNVNAVFDGRIFSDVVMVQWTSGGVAHMSEFGGTHFGFDAATGAVTGGKVTGYLQNEWNGSAWVPSWGVDDFSISASLVSDAIFTPSTSDDLTVIQTILKGNDTFFGSPSADYVNGFTGNDTLIGNGGKDTLFGGSGDDT